MLTCRDCGRESLGAAWHWIALRLPGEDGVGPEVVSFCPRCAESRFNYFSELRTRREHDGSGA